MRRRNFYLVLATLVFLLSQATRLAQAAPEAKASELRPAEEYLALATQGKPSKNAVLLKQAWDALKAKKWPSCRDKSRRLRTTQFADYGYWLNAMAWQQEGQRQLEVGNAKGARTSALNALEEFEAVDRKIPYTPLQGRAHQGWVRAKLLSADAQALLAQKGQKALWADALREYEFALQRSLLAGQLGFVGASSIEKFAQTCAAVKNSFCELWAQRLALVAIKGSDEAKAIQKAFPGAWNRGVIEGFDRLTRSYPAVNLDFDAFNIAMQLYLSGEHEDAIVAFRRFLDEFPKSVFRYRARYWLARALQKDEEEEEAGLAFAALQADGVLTYYGLLSSFETGKAMEQSLVASVPMASSRASGLTPAEIFRLERAEDLLRAKADELAVFELKDFRSRDALPGSFLMYLVVLNHLAGHYSGSFHFLSELMARGYAGLPSSLVLPLIFPKPYAVLIEKIAAEEALDPILLMSLIKQESSFDAEVVSRSGALGLTQLMPATAFEVLPAVSRVELLRAETNIKAGAKYLKQMITRFNGNIVLALAGYNAGPSAAGRWFKQMADGRSMAEFIETIPYRETREYVAAIVRNHYWYSTRAGVPAKPMDYFWPKTTK